MVFPARASVVLGSPKGSPDSVIAGAKMTHYRRNEIDPPLKQRGWSLLLLIVWQGCPSTSLDALSSQTKCNTLLRCCHGIPIQTDLH